MPCVRIKRTNVRKTFLVISLGKHRPFGASIVPGEGTQLYVKMTVGFVGGPTLATDWQRG
jgi:hypothetical protein